MQLKAEVKDDNYQEMPRQQEAMYAKSTDTFLRADASTGKHYYDLNAATKSYSGPWLFGTEHIELNVDRMRGQWVQWCPIPADIRDGVLMRGNVIYQNPNGTYRMSTDVYEGVIETHGDRYFVGRTQHTFQSPNLPGGRLQVVANIRIRLNQRLAYNPIMPPSQPPAMAGAPSTYSQYYEAPPQPAWGYSHNNVIAPPQGNQVVATYGNAPPVYEGGTNSRYGQRDAGVYRNDPDGGF